MSDGHIWLEMTVTVLAAWPYRRIQVCSESGNVYRNFPIPTNVLPQQLRVTPPHILLVICKLKLPRVAIPNSHSYLLLYISKSIIVYKYYILVFRYFNLGPIYTNNICIYTGQGHTGVPWEKECPQVGVSPAPLVQRCAGVVHIMFNTTSGGGVEHVQHHF